MTKVVFRKEYILNYGIDSLRPLLAEKLKAKNREHLITPSGLLVKICGRKIRFYYRFKKLGDEDISLVPGKISDLTVHHKYARAVLFPIDDSSTKLTVDFVDDSKFYTTLARFVFFSLFVLFSSSLTFSAVGDGISYTAAGIISIFFAALWLFIAYIFTKNISSESDGTFPLLEKEFESLLNNL